MPVELRRCPCCLGTRFTQHDVIWPDLIAEWDLSTDEAKAISRQQGLRCDRCRTGLRGMALATAMMRASRSPVRPFGAWAVAGGRRLLELNTAAELHRFLRYRRRRGYTFAEYPDVDMQALPYDDGAFDMVVHSDTLEHVADPVKGLGECRRVLRPGGALVFTIPVVGGRMSRRRDDLPPSFHGSADNPAFRVVTEYGADFWTQVFAAGFTDLRMVCIDHPTGVAYIAR